MRTFVVGLVPVLGIGLLVQSASQTAAAEKTRKSGNLTMCDYGHKGKKASGLKARTNEGQRKANLGPWSKVDGLDVTWETPSAAGSSKGKKAK